MSTFRSKKPKVLIVEDEPDAVELAELHLRNEGYEILTAADGNTALKKAREQLPNLIVLDLMIPEVDGLEVCKILRRHESTAGIPIIMLTAKGSEIDRVVGLELGADDYLTKPYSPRELTLRVKNLLRRRIPESENKDQLRSGILLLDIPRHEVIVKNRPVRLTATEFKLLALLMQRRGRVQSRDRLLRDVWDYASDVDTRTVDTHMRRLREKLGEAGGYLDTVRGVGYRFIGE